MGNRLAVIHVEWGRHWSGGTNQVLLLMRGLQERGVQGQLVCATKSAIAQRAAEQQIPVVSFPLRGEHDLPTWLRFALWLKSFALLSLLHVHSRKGMLPTLLIARWLKLPTVMHWRVAAPMPRPLAWLAQFVITNSQAAAQVAHQVGVPKERTAVIRSVVESDRFAPPSEAKGRSREQWELPLDAFVIASLGRMVAGKGYGTLLEAVALIPPEERPYLLVAGDGPLRETLERKMAQRRLGKWVRFLGFQPDVRSVLWAADGLVHVPTRFPEGTPNALLEAMAAGLFVVATPVGGIGLRQK